MTPQIVTSEYQVKGQTIGVVWYPKAAKYAEVVGPLLEKSYGFFLRNNKKDVVSRYMGDSLIVITTSHAEHPCLQMVLLGEEIGDMPPDQQERLRRQMAELPEINNKVRYGLKNGKVVSADNAVRDGQHRTSND